MYDAEVAKKEQKKQAKARDLKAKKAFVGDEEWGVNTEETDAASNAAAHNGLMYACLAGSIVALIYIYSITQNAIQLYGM
jgi:hypothetical protein